MPASSLIGEKEGEKHVFTSSTHADKHDHHHHYGPDNLVH